MKLSLKLLLFAGCLVLATHCASSSIQENPESEMEARNAREISEREALRRRLAEEEQKRSSTMKQIAEEKAARERVRQEARRKEEERRSRAEIAAAKQEEDRRRREQAQEKSREQKEREEEQKLKEEEETKARLEADRIEAERKRLEEREKRRLKADPDRRAFFRIESRKFGENIVCRIPSSQNAMVYRNKKPLQFHGFAAGRELIRPDVDQGMVLQAGELSSNLTGRKGNFIVIVLPDEKSRTLLQEFDLLRCDGVPGSAFVIGIESDGEGSILMEVEQSEQRSSGRYYRIAPDSVRIVKD
ncbi:MAG: hypothetical protein K8S54_14860 [Spirochaetia bacterium]|nr:hypothetical protein [Spirochaetia bacterium]